MTQESLLNEDEVAALLNLSVRTVQIWRLRGGGPPFIKLRKHVRYKPSDVAAFVAAHTRRSTSDTGPTTDVASLSGPTLNRGNPRRAHLLPQRG